MDLSMWSMISTTSSVPASAHEETQRIALHRSRSVKVQSKHRYMKALHNSLLNCHPVWVWAGRTWEKLREGKVRALETLRLLTWYRPLVAVLVVVGKL